MEALVSPGKLGLREQTVVYGMTETSPVTFGCGKCPFCQRILRKLEPRRSYLPLTRSSVGDLRSVTQTSMRPL